MKRARNSVASRISALAHNLWWSWNPDVQRLFSGLDPAQWEATRNNPLKTLTSLTPERRATLEQDPAFAIQLSHCEAQLRRYLSARTWFQRSASASQRKLRIAYFSAEFAIHESLPQYAGGLGVLAGDHLKSASDLGIPLVAVGLLYRCGYYQQELRSDGTTRVVYSELDFAALPITPTGKRIRLRLAKRNVHVAIWQAVVGRVTLYLLDTDVPENTPKDRAITRHLYGGDSETRIQQEIILGMGGVAALDALGRDINVFHLNEGHAAFASLERLRRLRAGGASLTDALREIHAGGVFTTHTPVPAGHDRFDRKLFTKYLGHVSDEVGVPLPALLALGSENLADAKTPFCMTVLALNMSGRRNGVAALHGKVSREMWMKVFREADASNVPISHITNGVHAETWLAPEIRPLYDKYLKPHWVGAGPRDDWWKRADRIPPAELWRVRGILRAKLVGYIRHRLQQQISARFGPVEELIAAQRTFDENALTLGFARRFATYKRAPLIFHDARRLARILGDPKRPVQLVFAGKAHPRDLGGQDFARQIYLHAAEAGFRGRVVLLEDYAMDVGRMLTSGVDVWLNNPIRPQEASGTSGMKPPLHGGLNCSILDGWWPEAYNGKNGWAIGDDRELSDAKQRDRFDSQSVYTLLESEIVPTFYDRDREDIPRRWVRMMIESMKTVCGQFNTHRMVSEYLRLYERPRR